MQRNKILIVEDEESLLKLESILLTSKGYKVVGVVDGKSAIQELSKEHPDLVIMDVMLPGDIDGFELCRRIKSCPDTADIHVIILTARKNSQDLDIGLKAGAAAYITKPFKSANLMATIQRLMESQI